MHDATASTFLRWLTKNAQRSPHQVFIHSIDQHTAITHAEISALHLADVLRAVNPRLILVEAGLGVDLYAAQVPGEWMPLGTWRPGAAEGFYANVTAQTDTPAYTPVNTRQDIASIFYTSGTASTPKGVVCTFGELYDNIQPTADARMVTAVT